MKTRKKLPETVYKERPLIAGMVKLDTNENPYPPPEEVVEAICRAARLVNRYPPEPRRLREAIAHLTGVEAENVLVGSGSDELIDLIVKAYVDKGAKTATIYPTFPMYERSAVVAGGVVERIPLNPDFTLDLDKALEVLSDSVDVFFISNPNNPTGVGFPVEQVEKLLRLGVLTVVDEAYYEFSGRTALNLLGMYDNLVVLRTFSKAYGLAGLRVGYCIASEEMIQTLLKVKPPYNVNLLAQEAALAVLRNRDLVLQRISAIKEARNRLYEALKRLDGVKPYPSETNFILVDVSETGLTSEEIADRLFKLGVSVRRFGRFEGFQGDFIRVTVGTPEENDRFLESLKAVLEEGSS